MHATPPLASPPSCRPKHGLRAIHWGWLAAVAGAHAAGFAALSGLDGEPQQELQPAEAAPISVRLLAPDFRPRPDTGIASPDPHAAPTTHATVPARGKLAPPPAHTRGRRPDALASPPPSAEAPSPSVGQARPETHSPQTHEEPRQPVGHPNGPETPDTSAPANVAGVAQAHTATAAGAGTSFHAPRYDAAYLDNPAPQYPKLSRRRGEEGKVTLRVRVRADGRAEAVEIAHGSGHPRLDDAALATVQSWRFVPARQGETPIDSSLLVPIVFRLDD
ncbi:energy transducer TonB [Aromatoleum toluclasticum]|uniref:energy transducer TonB n=1 Tax=Aromatoleum toluclasticum TaxID=92003 RepID=UPI001D17E1AE|nr:energy transducer TonB [Aromatoleum toluclasticum]MCC4116792.1 energy transducer TonB [Aromatoleum toluclasticum]